MSNGEYYIMGKKVIYLDHFWIRALPLSATYIFPVASTNTPNGVVIWFAAEPAPSPPATVMS